MAKKHSKGKGECWWKSIDDVDPISLQPLSELPCPPFEISFGDGGNRFLFDADVLAEYVKSQGKFENPMNRVPLSREDCIRLDAHLGTHGKTVDTTSVTEAFDLQQLIRVKGGDGTDAAAQRQLTLRREASIALLNLFQFRGLDRRRRGKEQERPAAQPQTGAARSGWTVIDDDTEEIVGQEAPELFPALSEMAAEFAQHLAERDLGDGFVKAAREDRFVKEQQRRLHEARRLAEEHRLNAKKAQEQRELQESRARLAAEKEREAQLAAAAAAKAEQDRIRALEEAANWQVAEAESTAIEAVAAKKAEEAAAAAAEEARRAREAAAAQAVMDAAAAAAAAERAEQERLEREKERKARKRDKAKAKKKAEKALASQIEAAAAAAVARENAKAAAKLKCAHCQQGIVGSGFERLEFSYCSPACVQLHRKVLESAK